MNNDLIYGKSQVNRIVSIEDNKDGTMQIFQQDESGKIVESTALNEYWILTDQYTDEHCRKLEGNGYYKYLNPFTLRDDFEQAKKHFNKFGDKSYRINDPKEAFMVRNGYSYYKGLKHQEVSVLSFDIETTTLEHTSDAKVLIISNTFRDSNGNKERKLFCYDEFKSDKEFFEAWCSWVREKDPSIVVGHNIFGFDLPYLDFCASRVDVELCLGRKDKTIRFNSYSSKFRKDQSQLIDYTECHIYGREIVDTYMLAIRHDVVQKKYESYGLKSIVKTEGLEVENRQFYDASLIRKNYLVPEEWLKIKVYALHDADDALALYDLMGAPSFYWAQSVPKPFQKICSGATGSQINSILIRSYLQNNYSLPRASQIDHFEGGVSVGIPGIYSNTFKVDLLSAYPSTILVYEIYDKKKDPKAHFLKIVEYFFNQRKEYKKLAKQTGDQYYKDMDATVKIAINSMYGTLGTPGLSFNFPEGAALITKKCRGYIDKAVQWATNESLEYWKNKNA